MARRRRLPSPVPGTNSSTRRTFKAALVNAKAASYVEASAPPEFSKRKNKATYELGPFLAIPHSRVLRAFNLLLFQTGLRSSGGGVSSTPDLSAPEKCGLWDSRQGATLSHASKRPWKFLHATRPNNRSDQQATGRQTAAFRSPVEPITM
jgi:hypothetical protein